MFPPHRGLWAWLLALVASLVSPSLLHAQPSFATNGLVAFYPFSGNANDASGNGRHGNVQGPTLVQDRFGRASSAYSFTGTKPQRITTPQPANFTQGLTVSAWLTADSNLLSESYVFGSGQNSSRWLGLRSDYRTGMETNKRRFFAEATTSSGYASLPPASETNPPVLTYSPGQGNWFHVVVTAGSGYLSVYVDGVLGRQQAVGNLSSPPSGNLVIGDFEDAITGNSWKGRIDDVRVYNRVLAPSEIAALYGYERSQEPFWDSAGTLQTGRSAHSATRLVDGRVLVTGGQVPAPTCCGEVDYLSSVEIYYPNTNGWVVGAPMAANRGQHTATLLLNGRVLVAGGLSATGHVTVCELYDPVTGSWSATGSLNTGRYGHTATRLGNGKVLVSAGCFGGSQTSSAEVYDPATGLWTPVGSLGTPRCAHTATLLPSGKVLVTGGYNGDQFYQTTELFDPVAGQWSPGPSMSVARRAHTATLLENGKVLLAGGYRTNTVLSSAEVYDPPSNQTTLVGFMTDKRTGHAASLLPNGEVLVGGGYNEADNGYLYSDVYSPYSGQWRASGRLRWDRWGGLFVPLQDGRVLAVGGNSVYAAAGQALAPAEIYVIPPPRRATAVAEITNGVIAAVRIVDGGYGYGEPPVVLVAGGGGSGATAVATVVNGVVTAITLTNPGSGYTSPPTVLVASPPFSPELAVEISRVRVRLKVVLGRRYVLESSFNLNSWTQVGNVFTAQAEELVQDFDVNTTGRYFRVQQVP